MMDWVGRPMCSFLLRMWGEWDNGRFVWRVSVTTVAEQAQVKGFGSFAEAVEFVEFEMNKVKELNDED